MKLSTMAVLLIIWFVAEWTGKREDIMILILAFLRALFHMISYGKISHAQAVYRPRYIKIKLIPHLCGLISRSRKELYEDDQKISVQKNEIVVERQEK